MYFTGSFPYPAKKIESHQQQVTKRKKYVKQPEHACKDKIICSGGNPLLNPFIFFIPTGNADLKLDGIAELIDC